MSDAHDDEELPRRARRRLLAPLPVALLLALLTACGFIAGVLVEKNSASSVTGAGGAGGAIGAARFAGLRGAGRGAPASGAGAAATSGAAAGPGGTGAGTVGTVAFIQGSTLYVTNAEGNTVKVSTAAASTVSKTVKSSVAAIHPGESVVITGGSSTGGVIMAEAIRVGAAGTASPFAGARAGGGGTGTPTLFGPG
ncbi:MAG TPA: hypothetical protein VGN13_13475 [Solirubrobacteraceae bacterium]|jgi:preprotein translocase subunit YajC